MREWLLCLLIVRDRNGGTLQVAPDRKMAAIGDVGSLDASATLTLNNAHARETSMLDFAGLTALLGMAFYARGVDRGATAFLIALEDSAGYINPSFMWFKACRKSFVYINRIVVSASARGQGIARRLYDDLFGAAERAGHDRAVCETHIQPPNPVSEAFHLAMGFVGVGEAGLQGGTKSVRYYEKKFCSPPLYTTASVFGGV